MMKFLYMIIIIISIVFLMIMYFTNVIFLGTYWMYI